MKICLVAQEYPPETAHGGIGTQTWTKAHGLARLGHEVHVLSCLSPSKQPPVAERSELRDGIAVHRIAPPGEEPGRRVALHDPAVYLVGYVWRVLEALERLARHHVFDLINFPEYGAEGVAYQLNRRPWNWTPVAVQLHGPLAMFADRVGWPDRESAFFRVGTFLEAESIRMADGLLASSANIADFAAAAYGAERSAIDVVHCGVDTALFRPPDGPRPGRPTVLFVGNVEASKGVKTVFEAVLRLRNRFPDVRLRIAGTGDFEETLRARARREGAEANVEFLGFVREREALPGLYREAHVFASPADHEVGVANVYVEAMACGCPVVASDTGGAPEAVLHEQTGLLVPARDVEATTAALGRILADPALRSRLGEGARRRAESYFATDRYLARVLAAYQRTLERSRERQTRLAAEEGAA